MRSRPAQPSESVPGQPKLHRKFLSRKIKKEKRIKKRGKKDKANHLDSTSFLVCRNAGFLLLLFIFESGSFAEFM